MNTAQKELKAERKRLHKIISAEGWKSDAGREAAKKEVALYKAFEAEHGREALLEVTVGKVCAAQKMHNSKGNGYGNL